MKIRLDADLRAWLHDEAAARRCSVAQVLRDLIVAEMARRGQG